MVDETLLCDSCGWLRFDGDDVGCAGCGRAGGDIAPVRGATLPALPPVRLAAIALALVAVLVAMATA